MTYAKYDAIQALRCSDLKLIRQSPAHYMANKYDPRPATPACQFGQLVHALVLEPDSWHEEFIVAPTVDRRTKAGKEAWTEFEQEAGDRTVIDIKAYDAACTVTAHTLNHPLCKALLRGGEAEKVIQWDSLKTPCKARIDYYKPGWIIDYKTTTNANRESFMRDCWNYKYHMQAAWYLDGAKASGLGECKFIFVAVEKDPPFSVACYVADKEMIEYGRAEYQAAMTTYLECVKKDTWPGIGWDYTAGRYEIQPITLPPWAI